MAEGLRFLHDFFTSKKIELEYLTITLEERPSFDITADDYRFRVEISETVDEIDIRCRNMAIEDHHSQTKHQKPHLQFKLHADKIGHIHIMLPIDNVEQYRKFILSFLDIIGSILIGLDNKTKDLQNNFMIFSKFEEIAGMGDIIKQVVYDSYKERTLMLTTSEKKELAVNSDYIAKIREIPQIAPFFDRIL